MSAASPDFGVVLFQATSHALQAETVTKQVGLTIKLIPVPRQFSSDCGMAGQRPTGAKDLVVGMGEDGQNA